MDQKFKEAMPIINHLISNGYDTYFVGGAVRDQLLGKPIGDIDIATEAKPDQVMALFDKVIPVGIEHGTVIVRFEEESYEVTTFRIDGEYIDYRRPDEVEYVSTIEEDLSRRDFTMNAIAMGRDGQLIDPYGGQKDIHHRTIQTVGSPDLRFQEDPLRIMRAIRFVSQHDFELSTSTYQAFDKWKYLLSHIAIERVAVELEKLFNGDNIQHAWDLLIESGLYAQFPLLKDMPFVVDSSKCVSWVPLQDLAEVIAVFYLLDSSTSIGTWVKHWKLSNRIKRKGLILVKAWELWQGNKEKHALYDLGQEHIESFYRLLTTFNQKRGRELRDLYSIYNSLPIHSRNDLQVDGNDIKAWFPSHKPGPWINQFLETIEKLILNENLNNDQFEIQERVTSWNPHELN